MEKQYITLKLFIDNKLKVVKKVHSFNVGATVKTWKSYYALHQHNYEIYKHIPSKVS